MIGVGVRPLNSISKAKDAPTRTRDLGCEDDEEYQFKDRDGKDCSWAGEKNKIVRCSKLDT